MFTVEPREDAGKRSINNGPRSSNGGDHHTDAARKDSLVIEVYPNTAIPSTRCGVTRWVLSGL